MLKKFYAFLADTSGATGIEYGFIAGTVGVTVMTGAFMLGNDISDIFETFSTYVNAEMVAQDGSMSGSGSGGGDGTGS